MLQAFGSLGSGDGKNNMKEFFELLPVQQAAKEHEKSPAQVLLRWALQKGVHVIPKSVRAERVKENGDLFSFALTQAEVSAIDACHENRRMTWKGLDPDSCE